MLVLVEASVRLVETGESDCMQGSHFGVGGRGRFGGGPGQGGKLAIGIVVDDQ